MPAEGLDPARIAADFARLVNMDAGELEAWLATPESRAAGQRKDGAAETIGHAAGRHVLAILRTPEPDRTAGDYRHMRKVVGFIRRHRAQQPADPVHSRWRRSLMNWGHDPLKD